MFRTFYSPIQNLKKVFSFKQCSGSLEHGANKQTAITLMSFNNILKVQSIYMAAIKAKDQMFKTMQWKFRTMAAMMRIQTQMVLNNILKVQNLVRAPLGQGCYFDLNNILEVQNDRDKVVVRYFDIGS